MDKQRFKEACESALDADWMRNGIGTLGEKTLHAVLKRYFEPDGAKHEIKVGSYVADIVTDEGIIEIQTRAFERLRKKLAAFLEIASVTVVFPVASTKWLLWIDESTGEVTKKRKSPRKGSIYDAVHELYKIKPFLAHPNLRLCVVLIDIEEYRLLDGWSANKKKGSTRFDRVPVDIVDEIYFSATEDYCRFIPAEMKRQFTSRDLKASEKIYFRTSQDALNILNHLEVAKRVGKQGNLYVYERSVSYHRK